METKIWDMSFSREDIEVLLGAAVSDGEWNIIVDELYNNDNLYNKVQTEVLKVARAAIEYRSQTQRQPSRTRCRRLA